MPHNTPLSRSAPRPSMDILEYRRPDPTERKELKVSLPSEIRIKLHVTKLLTGRSITQIVQDALLAYFEETAGKSGQAAMLAPSVGGGEEEGF